MSDNFATAKEILIPVGSVLKSAPTKKTFIEKHYSLLIGLGDDHTAELIISESALKSFPSFFLELKPTISITE